MPPSQNQGVLDGRAAVAIEYFLNKSMPILRQCKSSPLWDYMLQMCHQQHEGSVVRSIASAIGQHQRVIEQKIDVESGANEQTDLAYNIALRAFRKDIAVLADDPTLYAAACLLLVVLESLRGSQPEILLHLQYCIYVIRQQKDLGKLGKSALMLLHEAALFLETFLVSTMNFDIFSKEAGLARQLVRELRSASLVADDVALIEQNLRIDLLDALDWLSINDPPSEDPAMSPGATAMQYPPRSLELEEAAMNSAVEEANQNENSDSKAYYLFVHARSLLTMLALRQISNPDRPPALDLEDLTRVVDYEQAALAHLQQSNSNWSSEMTSFSLGLGTISTLYHVAVRCKDFYLRRRALLVLEMCPQREGVWTVEQARKVARIIIRLEEGTMLRRYGLKNCTIPEDCQIRHTSISGADGQKTLRVFWRTSQGPGVPIFEDIILT